MTGRYIIEKNNIYIIDGEKLRSCIKKTGKSEAVLSDEIGFNRCYFTQAVNRNRLKYNACVWLEKNYGIHLDDYAVKEQEEAPAIEKVEFISPEHAMELSEQMSEINDEIRKVAVQIEKLPHLKCMNADDCVANLTKDELLNAIYKAVYSAVSHAMKERK